MERTQTTTSNLLEQIPSAKRRTWAEIDLDAIEHNFQAIQGALRQRGGAPKLCCVVKANAYGHSATALGPLCQRLGADYFATSNIEEAVQLRRAGTTKPILILGWTPPDCARLLADYDVAQSVFSYEYGAALSAKATALGATVKTHVKIDSGMGRIGFLSRGDADDEIEQATRICKAPGLSVEGAFAHFAVADDGADGERFTREQFKRFRRAVDRLEASGVEIKLKHCANSAAIFDYPEFHWDMVRAGVALYGLRPSEKVRNLPTLRPAMRLRSIVSHVKTVKVGQTVGYGRTFCARNDLRVATIPIGYADGFWRANGISRYRLEINGRLAPIIGRVCMDQLTINATGIDCEVGDVATVFGGDAEVSADALAAANGTINYEIVCDVGARVPRAFVRNGRIIGWEDAVLGVSKWRETETTKAR